MCRLALLNNEGIKYIEKEQGGIKNFFNVLERSFGGHGNGYCIITKDGKQIINKGSKLSNKTISEEILNNLNNVKWVLYHTRLASIGHISDENCHPFERGENVLMMNGTERQFKECIVGTMTDTEYILDKCYNLDVDIFNIVNDMKSVFVGIEKQKVFITKGYGSLKLLKVKRAIVFASEFPSDYFDKVDIYESPVNWVEGKRILIKNLCKAEDIKKTYGKYGNNYKTVAN